MKEVSISNTDFLEFLDAHPNSMFYHTPNYLKFAAEILGASVKIYALFFEDKIIACCPWLIKEGAFGKVYNSLAYFGANGGILANDVKSKQDLEKAMKSEISKDAISSVNITNLFERFKNENKIEITISRRAQVTKLIHSESDNDIMEMFHSKTRNMVRKGLKENFDFYPTNDSFFLENTHKQNMEAVGVAPKEHIFFELLPQFFEQNKEYDIFEATIDGEKAAALLVFYHKETVEYYMPAIHIDYRNKQAMSALIFKVIQYCIAKGFKLWNWGGTPASNENLYRFKERFGATEYPYFIEVNIYDSAILTRSAKEISEVYPGMFVVPFDRLSS